MRITSITVRFGWLLAAVLLLSIAPSTVSSKFVPEAGAVVGDCITQPSWGTLRTDYASQVVTLVNQHRQSLGRVTLSVSPTLTKAAEWKAMHMAGYGYMAHNDPAPPIARTVGQRLEACGYPVASAGWGENIAYGYSTPTSVMNAWLNSAGHKANIENASYRAIGVGAASNASGVLYWSQEFGTIVDSGSGGGGGTSAPTVSLTSFPASSTTSTNASFGWATGGLVSSTSCSLDNGAAVMCSSPWSYSGLAVGAHTFRVTVGNSGGSTSASYNWTVTSTPTGTAPTVSITSAPATETTSTGATFAFTTGGAPTSTTCKLDSFSAVACTSPTSYSGLAVGTHTFTVTVGNAYGSRSASYSWTVTTTSGGGTATLPKATFTSYPPSVTTSKTAFFGWTTTGSPTSTTCSLDGAAATACSSGKYFTNLASGYHTFKVTVANSAGSSTTARTWRVY